MSQQKLLVAVCLFGAVALAAAQMNFDMNSCQRGFQQEMGEYRVSGRAPHWNKRAK